MDEDSSPSAITPVVHSPRRPSALARRFTARLRSLRRAFTTRDGLVGDYDYAFLFRPNLPFMNKGGPTSSPFFAMLLGLQHALAMLAGVITPPIILSGSGGANLSGADQQYLVSTALIVSGILSAVQINRVRIPKTK